MRGEPLARARRAPRPPRSRARTRCISVPRIRKQPSQSPPQRPSRSALAPTTAGVLAAHLREHGPRKRAFRQAPPDLSADLGRAGERDTVDRRADQGLAGLRASVDERDDSVGHARLGEQARDGPARRAAPPPAASGPRRSPRARAAAVIPNPSAKGKLKGAITPKTPYGRRTSVLRSSGDSWPSGVSNPSADSTWQAVRLDQVDRLLDLGDRLRPHLPHLDADRRRELELALVDQPLGRAQDRDALRVRKPPPLALCCARRLDRLGDELGALVRAAGDVLATRRILARERLARRDVAPGNEMCERLRVALPRVRERRLERAVELGAARARRVRQPGRHRRNSISRHGGQVTLRRSTADGGRPRRSRPRRSSSSNVTCARSARRSTACSSSSRPSFI